MKRARGDIRKIMLLLSEIQTLVGRAKSSYQNDRDNMRAEHVVNPLEQAFDLCVEARSYYENVEK